MSVTSEISVIFRYFVILFLTFNVNLKTIMWVKVSILFGNVISLYISTSPKRKLRNNIDVIDSNTLRAIIKYVSRPKCASISIWISISISPIFWVTNNRQRRYRPTSTVDIVVTFARPAERVEVFNIFGCHFEWFWATLSDLAMYSVTWSIARFLCNSWVSCLGN